MATATDNDNQERNLRNILVALAFLMISLLSIFCSAWVATQSTQQYTINANMRSNQTLLSADRQLLVFPIDSNRLEQQIVIIPNIEPNSTPELVRDEAIQIINQPTPTVVRLLTSSTPPPLPIVIATSTALAQQRGTANALTTTPNPTDLVTGPTNVPTSVGTPVPATAQATLVVGTSPTAIQGTSTVPVPSATRPLPTDTPAASPTAPATTATVQPPTGTANPTETRPIATPLLLPSSTPVAPTQPPTDEPERSTDTPVPTNTSIPPTATPILPTNTPSPTATHTPQPTDTPTATSSATNTPTHTATATPTVTNTPTETNTPTPTSVSISFVASAYKADEADTTAVINVELSGSAPSGVSVNYQTNDNTANSGEDYQGIAGVLNIPAGQTTGAFSIGLLEDSLDEANETISLSLSNPINATLGTPTEASLTIIDNDVPPSVQFANNSYTVTESEASALLTVSLSAASGQEVTTIYSTTRQTAQPAVNYTPLIGNLVFAPGQTSRVVVIGLLDNSLVQGDQQFAVDLINANHATLGTITQTIVSIIDNDIPSVTLNQAQYQVDEAAGTAIITLTLSASAPDTVQVNYQTQAGTAVEGRDYAATSGTAQFFTPQTVVTFTIPITDDTIFRDNRTVLLSLNSPNNAILGTLSSAELTIVEDDALPVVDFSSPLYIVNESETSVDVVVTLDKTTGLTATVQLASNDETATSGSDYGTLSTILTFSADKISQTVSVPILADLTFENREAFELSLTSPSNLTLASPATTTIEIVDDDSPPTVQLEQAAYTFNEDAGQDVLTLTLSTSSVLPTTVDVQTSDNTAVAGADYQAVNETVTFAPGEISKHVSITLIDNVLIDGSKNFAVSLSNPTGATVGSIGATTVTLNDDEAPPNIQFAATTISVPESGGTVSLTVTLNLTSTDTVTVSYQTADITAIAPNDYTSQSGTLVFPPNTLSQNITIPIIDDAIVEASQQFSVTLSNPIKGVLGAPAQTVVTLLDNPRPTLQFTTISQSMTETVSSVTVAVSLSSAVSNTTQVDYTTLDGSATAGSDYQATSGTLNFAAGQTIQTLSVNLLNDGLLEADEAFVISLTNPISGDIGTPATTTITIVSEDRPNVAWDTAGYTAAENTGQAVINLVASEAPLQPFTVTYTTIDGTAIGGTDFPATTAQTVFATSQTSLTLTLPITNDAIQRGTRLFSVTLSSSQEATLGSITTTMITITDADVNIGVVLSSRVFTVSENSGSALITVTLSQPAGASIDVNYATSPNTASNSSDYTDVSNTLNFPIGVDTQTFSVPLVNDNVAENEENFTITLSSPTAPGILDTPFTSTVIVTDADAPLRHCYNLDVAMSHQQIGSTVYLTATATNNYTNTITVRGANLIVYRNTDEHSPTIRSGISDIDIANPVAFIYQYKGPFNMPIAPAGQLVLTGTYNLTTSAGLRFDDDLFTFRYYEGTESSPPTTETYCSFGEPVVSPAAPTGTVTVEITSPTANQLVNTDAEATFGAVITATNPISGFGWVNYEIYHVATNERIWDYIEYTSDFCTFTGNGPCSAPSATGFLWDDLTNGEYRLDVTGVDSGGEVGTASQIFRIDR